MKYKLNPAGDYNIGIALICGGICAFSGIAERFICGAPYTVIHTLGIGGLLPPVWLISGLCLAWLFAVGGAFGAVMSSRHATQQALRGCVFASLALGAGFFWYPLFFSAVLMFPAILCVAAVTVCSVISALYWFRDNTLPSIIMWLYSAWTLYLLILSLIIIGK